MNMVWKSAATAALLAVVSNRLRSMIEPPSGHWGNGGKKRYRFAPAGQPTGRAGIVSTGAVAHYANPANSRD